MPEQDDPKAKRGDDLTITILNTDGNLIRSPYEDDSLKTSRVDLR